MDGETTNNEVTKTEAPAPGAPVEGEGAHILSFAAAKEAAISQRRAAAVTAAGEEAAHDNPADADELLEVASEAAAATREGKVILAEQVVKEANAAHDAQEERNAA